MFKIKGAKIYVENSETTEAAAACRRNCEQLAAVLGVSAIEAERILARVSAAFVEIRAACRKIAAALARACDAAAKLSKACQESNRPAVRPWACYGPPGWRRFPVPVSGTLPPRPVVQAAYQRSRWRLPRFG